MKSYLILLGLLFASFASAQFLQHRRGAFTASEPAFPSGAVWVGTTVTTTVWTDGIGSVDLANSGDPATSSQTIGTKTVTIADHDFNDSYFVADNNVFDMGTTMTMAIWWQPKSDSGNGYLFSHRQASDEFAYALLWLNASDAIQFQVSSSGTSMTTETSDDINGAPDTTPGDDGLWYHVVGRADGTTIDIFVNGTQRNAPGTSFTANIFDSAAQFVVGGRAPVPVSDNAAWRYQPALWSRALTDQEITDLYNGGTPLNNP